MENITRYDQNGGILFSLFNTEDDSSRLTEGEAEGRIFIISTNLFIAYFRQRFENIELAETTDNEAEALEL
jgi:hypothetical protein